MPGQNGRNFADYIFKYTFLNKDVWFLLKILQKFVPKVLIQYSSIGSDNGLVPTRRQAFIWNDGSLTDAYMRHSASIS